MLTPVTEVALAGDATRTSDAAARLTAVTARAMRLRPWREGRGDVARLAVPLARISFAMPAPETWCGLRPRPMGRMMPYRPHGTRSTGHAEECAGPGRPSSPRTVWTSGSDAE